MVTFYRAIYSLLFALVIPLEIIRLLIRSRKAPDYRSRWGERFALSLPEAQTGTIWFHTVSVGETLAALPVIKHVLNQYPDRPVLVTTMTPTGSERVWAALGDSVTHCYAPYDLPNAMVRFYQHFNPEVLFIMETELWPNMIHEAHVRQVPVVLMNARMSQKSANGYRRFDTLTRDMLNKLAHIAVQNETDARRFVELGANPDSMTVTGNIKFDLKTPDDLDQKLEVFKTHLHQRPVWLAASTHLGEDEIVLSAHKKLLQQYPDACLIIVPRHPERFEAVFQLCREQNYNVQRRSRNEWPIGEVYLGDTMGELLQFCTLADMTFMGGSLIENGGHNCLEVSAFAKPVMSGPHDFNFAEINKELYASGGLTYIKDAETMYEQLVTWLTRPELAKKAGKAGLTVVNANRGAVSKLLAQLAHFLNQ